MDNVPKEVPIEAWLDPVFGECLMRAIDSDFVTEWSRLRKCRPPRSAIESMVDEATGNGARIARLFAGDVYSLIYARMLPTERAKIRRALGLAEDAKEDE